jgi:hypothetical protein
MTSVDKSSSSPKGNPSILTGRNWIERRLVSYIANHTPKCREVVRLLSQSMEVKLPITTRFKLRAHFLICAWCRRYERQLWTLRKIASSVPEHVDDINPKALSGSVKERLKQALRRREH